MSECSRDELNRIINENKRIAVVYTANGCPVCPNFMSAVKKGLQGKKVALVEVEVAENDGCIKLAEEARVKGTPTLYFYKKGKLKKKLYSTGVEEEDKKQVEALIG